LRATRKLGNGLLTPDFSSFCADPPVEPFRPAPPAGTEPSQRELLQSGFRYALSLSHHHQDAEDLTQEAWVKLSRRYGAVASRAALFTTIRNLFIDRCRRAQIVPFVPLDETTPDPPEDQVVAAGTKPDLESLLGSLRDGEREAIYLHYVEGHTAEEIGHLTRQPRGTILSLLHRAFRKLQAAASTPR
jgi:RNA polymerase sigma-70 factor, ECF subfamily